MFNTSNYNPEGVALPVAKSPGTGDPIRRLIESPPPALAPLVLSLWSTSWHLEEGQSIVVPVVPNCCVSLVFQSNNAYRQADTAKIVGPLRAAYMWQIAGSGSAFGVTFTPGGFAPYFGKPLRELLDQTLAFEACFGESGAKFAQSVLANADVHTQRLLIERFLLDRMPQRIPAALTEAMAIFNFIVSTSACVRLADLEEKFGITERSLQRLFDEFMGVSPKMAIKTARFQDALKAILADKAPHWADLAASLGYSDQAHFIRDFRTITGMTPAKLKSA